MTLEQYVANINQAYKRGTATEHTYRGDLKQLLESIVTDIIATNEPKRISCGAPDYVLTRKDIPFGFIEAKDVGDKDLSGLKKTGNKEQFDRYKTSLDNLIFTDYIDFHFYQYDVFITKITIAELKFPSSGGVPNGRGGSSSGGVPNGRGGLFGGEIIALPENFIPFTNLIKNFCLHVGQTIKSSKKLAEMMASKARLLANIIEEALTSDEINNENSTLKDQMNAFKEILIHDISPKGFADVYAQTIAYGMFCARLHDPTLPTFSRQEAAELIPKSNPFLRKLFGYIAGPDLDDRIKWVVDSLVDIFLACDVAEILKTYGKSTKMEDPIIHFYETFLSEYDPKLRKAKGVWYTPKPVVNFIVRAVDDILKTEFNLPQGLADTSKIKITTPTYGHPSRGGEVEVHKVQILDPATGTGTFLAEVVKHIHKKFGGQQGIWSNYIETHLLPRLNGFELLMASYAMAHLQMDLLLTETGYKPTTPTYGHPSRGGELGRGGQRLRIYLTNSLEESHPDTGTLFANWLSAEANEANFIKRDSPVMCIIGNPPYAVSSTNKNEWIQNLISDYKKDLNERKINLDDDYIKFIRYGQHYVDKNGSGILAYISNNSFIDGITHRQMRKNLLETFDKIYILDLHGNAKKKEVCLDGSADQNVFDIMQGVSINIFVKTGNKKKNELGKVFHFDLQGKREFKYDFLYKNSIKSLDWKKLEFIKPNYFFVPKNFDEILEYEKGFRINDVLILNSNGIETKCDSLAIHFNKKELENVINDFINDDVAILKNKYKEKQDSSGWNFSDAKISIKKDTFFQKEINYRPFDTRETIITKNSGGFIGRSRFEVMKHFLKPNVGLIIPRQTTQDWRHSFITNKIFDGNFTASAKLFGTGCAFPLYLYPETNGQLSTEIPPDPSDTWLEEQPPHPSATWLEEQPPHPSGTPPREGNRTPNLKPEIVDKIAKELGLAFVSEKAIALNSPPMEGCPTGGVENSPPLEGCPTGGVVSTTFAPIDILDYIYAVLHSPSYREKYKEFLKIDFPKIPFPKDANTFWQLVQLGSELRQIHLLESDAVVNYITQYPVDGDNVVEKIKFEITINTSTTSNSPPLEGCPTGGVENSPPLVGCSTTGVDYNTENYPTGRAEKITPQNFFIIKNTKIHHNTITELPYNIKLRDRAKALRYAENLSEVLFWMQVHKGIFYKIDFDRQKIIGNYIVDFYVKKLGLVVEIDGSSHIGKEKYDAQREDYLKSLGLRIFRIPVVDILQNMGKAMRDLENYIVENYGENVEPPRPSGTPPEDGNLPPRPSGTPPEQGNCGKVFINETQYFDNVPEIAWNFYIGGYQPAQKWLKDRKGNTLNFEDIFHYQKIIVALAETDRIMKKINEIEIEKI